MQKFKVQKFENVPDGEGGSITDWTNLDDMDLEGYLDLVTGNNQTLHIHNAQIQESTHVLVVPTYQVGITDKMRIVDKNNNAYVITYVDDPVNVGHHLEIYLKFSEVLPNG